jgi:hypothetical protein
MIDDRELTPVWGCAATVERPYETIDDRELIPGLIGFKLLATTDDNPHSRVLSISALLRVRA